MAITERDEGSRTPEHREPDERCIPGSTGPTLQFEELRGLVAHRPGPSIRSAGVPIPKDALLRILKRLEGELARQASGRSQAELLRIRLRQALRHLAEDGRDRSLLPEDQDTLDLVFLLFDQIQRYLDLEPRIQEFIGRLQIPIAQLALEDKGFFTERQHPARMLIEHLAQAGIGWEDSGDPEIPARIGASVQAVLEGFRRDRPFYKHVDGAFVEWFSAYRRPIEAAEAEARRMMEAREEEAGAEATVDKLIAARLQAFDAYPEAIESFLREGWRQVLIAAYRQEGLSGTPWKTALETLDQILWSIRPKRSEAEREKLIHSIPELLRAVRRGLDGVHLEPRWIAAWFRALQNAHLQVLYPGSPPSPPPSIPNPSEGKIHPDDGEAIPALCQGLGLTVNTWLRLHWEGRWRRVKLLWQGVHSGQLLFVDHRGQPAFEWSPADLIQSFVRNRTRILGRENTGILDTVLEHLTYGLETR